MTAAAGEGSAALTHESAARSQDEAHSEAAQIRVPLSAGVLRLLAGRGVSLVLNFLAWALIARALQPESFGFLQFGIAVVFYLSFLTDFGLTTLGTRELATQHDGRRLVRELLGLRLALAAVAVVVGTIGILLFTEPAATRWTWVILLSTVAASAINAIWILRAIGRSMALAIVDVAAAISLFGGAAAVWALQRDPTLAAAVFGASQWLAAAASVLGVGNADWLRPSLRNAVGHLRSAVPLAIAVLAVNIYYSSDTVLLGLLRTKEEVGYYAAAYKLVLPWLLVASIVGHLAMPALARLAPDRPSALEPSLRRLSTTLTVFGTSAAIGVALLSTILIVTIFGITYAPAATPLAILIWSCVTVFANAPFGFLMLARRQDRAYMWTAVAGAVLNLALNALLIPMHGMIGAAFATLAAEVLVLTLMLWLTRDVSLPIISRSAAIAVPTAAAVGLAMWPFSSSLIAIPIGLAVFGVALLASRVVTIGQLRDLLQLAASRRH